MLHPFLLSLSLPSPPSFLYSSPFSSPFLPLFFLKLSCTCCQNLCFHICVRAISSANQVTKLCRGWRKQHTQLQLLLLLAVFQLGKEKWHFQCRFPAHSLNRANINAYILPGWKKFKAPEKSLGLFLSWVIEVNGILLHENHLFGSRYLLRWQPRLAEEGLMPDYAEK